MYDIWLKAFHIIAMVAWFSGLFYLPRLFVYHCGLSPHDTNESKHYQRFCTMEYKLYAYITTPAAIITTLLGLWLLYDYAFILYKKSGWLHTKIMLVIFLWVYHYYCGKLVKNFKNKQNMYSEKFYRIFNEIPTFFLVSIVILAVVKPF